MPSNSDTNFNIKKFKDESFIQTKEDYILIDLQEENVDYEKENFEIEVYLVDDKDKGFNNINQEMILPLFFEKKKEQVIDGILIEQEDDKEKDFLDSSLIVNDPSFTKYWFNLFVDNEIPPDILCKNINEDQKRLLAEEFNLDCDELLRKANIPNAKISSDVEISDLDEKC